MRGTLTAAALLVTVLVQLAAAPAAAADGLPVLGIEVGGTGVATPQGSSRYVTIPAGPDTVVARVSRHGGKIRASRLLRGTFTIPAVAYDGSAGGLAHDGRTLVLIEPRRSFPRARTKLVVLETPSLRTERTIDLRGDFSFDAVSPHGTWLYLIQYVSPQDWTRYRVRALNTASGDLVAQPVVDPRERGDKMRGNPLSRVTSADGRWAYTLYDGGGVRPFVHALDTVARTARCIDLDELGGLAPGMGWTLRSDTTRDAIVVRHDGASVARVDLRTLAVSTGGADAAASGASDAVLVTGGAVAAAVVVSPLLWLRRRRRVEREADGATVGAST